MYKTNQDYKPKLQGYAVTVFTAFLCVITFANCGGGGNNDSPSVESVAVRADDTGVGKGGTLQFYATVAGVGNPAQTVDWSIASDHNVSTVINKNGLLSVVAYEINTSLAVRATSTVDNSKYGEMTVTVAVPSVESVTVQADVANVFCGETLQFHATVIGSGNPARTVIWSVTGEHDAATVISESGLLSVAAGENNGNIVVRATSTVDDSKYGEKTATVRKPWDVAFLSRPASAKISYVNVNNVKISDKSFRDMADEVAIVIDNCENVEITRNDFSNVLGGIYLLNSKNVRITWNRFSEIGNGFVGSGRSNYIQLNNTFGGYVANNKGKGGNTEDMISIFQSGGSSSSDPLIIEHNALESNNWVSKYGSGIMLGDGGGSNVIVRENTCLSPGQVGIGVASGTNIRVIGNVIYGAPRVDSNVGIYVWNQYPSDMANIEVSNNRVRWYQQHGSENPYWNGELYEGRPNPVTGESSNDWHADIDPNTLRVIL